MTEAPHTHLRATVTYVVDYSLASTHAPLPVLIPNHEESLLDGLSLHGLTAGLTDDLPKAVAAKVEVVPSP